MIPLIEAIGTAETRPAAYVLKSVDSDYLYKGACRDLRKRLKDHMAGRVSRTKNRRPLALAYWEHVESFTEARKRENYFKSGAGRVYLRRRLGKDSGA